MFLSLNMHIYKRKNLLVHWKRGREKVMTLYKAFLVSIGINGNVYVYNHKNVIEYTRNVSI